MLQHVIKSDKKRERHLREERLLASAIDNAADPTAVVQAYRQVDFERLEHHTHDARQIALRRSGARGAKAKKALLQREAELEEAQKRSVVLCRSFSGTAFANDWCARLQQPSQEYDATEIGEGSRKAADLLGEIQTSLELVCLL